MKCKWLLVIALGLGSVQAAPSHDSGEPQAQETSILAVDESKLSANLHTQDHSESATTGDIIGAAINLLGVRYRPGGTSAATGFDCSGFVRSIYHETVGHLLPRKARDQAKATEKIDKKHLRPGDLVFFNTMRRAFSHVGIYIGDGQFIHAPSRGKGVRIESMNASYWAKRFNGARRVPVTMQKTTNAEITDF